MIHWLALGLNSEPTGIENMILRHARDFSAAWRIDQSTETLTLHVDAGAKWPQGLPGNLRVQSHPDRRARLAFAPERRYFQGATIIHSFGSALPRLQGTSKCYTIYDWGPFQDTQISLTARALWSSTIVRSIRQSDCVYFYSESVVASTPPLIARMLQSKQLHIIAPPTYPQSERTIHGSGNVDSPFLLFVGTDVPRKRLALLVAAVKRTDFHLMLVGEGTERYSDGSVTGLGRVDDATLDLLYDDALAVVLVSEYEGFGLPVVEAIAHGLPAIVSKEVATIHQDQPVGSLLSVDTSSSEALAASLRTLEPLLVNRSRHGEFLRADHSRAANPRHPPLELTYVGK